MGDELIGVSRKCEQIPSGPFMLYIQRRIEEYAVWLIPEDSRHGEEGACLRLCREFGWDETAPDLKNIDSGLRRLHRYRYGVSERTTHADGKITSRRTVHRDTYGRALVEDALYHAGGYELFAEVYPPGLYPALHDYDIPLEPAQWCPGCQAECTPILSVCPWCEWRFHRTAA